MKTITQHFLSSRKILLAAAITLAIPYGAAFAEAGDQEGVSSVHFGESKIGNQSVSSVHFGASKADDQEDLGVHFGKSDAAIWPFTYFAGMQADPIKTGMVKQNNSESQIGDEGDISTVIRNTDELQFWLSGTEKYQLEETYSPVRIFQNALGGEGIEVKPGTRTRQCYLIKDGIAERLEKALDTRFYRANNFTEPFPQDFDYLGFCDYKEKTMLLVPNPFSGERK